MGTFWCVPCLFMDSLGVGWGGEGEGGFVTCVSIGHTLKAMDSAPRNCLAKGLGNAGAGSKPQTHSGPGHSWRDTAGELRAQVHVGLPARRGGPRALTKSESRPQARPSRSLPHFFLRQRGIWLGLVSCPHPPSPSWLLVQVRHVQEMWSSSHHPSSCPPTRSGPGWPARSEGGEWAAPFFPPPPELEQLWFIFQLWEI